MGGILDADDVDGREYYIHRIDPYKNFNQVEITLSHLFRHSTGLISGKTFGDCLIDYITASDLFRSSIIEVGCGMGDIAKNILRDREVRGISRYVMADISPALQECQRNLLEGLADEFILADATELSKAVAEFSGMILSIGMIADLRSIHLTDKMKPQDYGISDPDMIDFVVSQNKINGDNWYFHVGTAHFLREISKIITSDGVALIAEYAATPDNQPSWFDNHFECGIDFDQLIAYCERLGLECKLLDIEEVLGIPRDIPLLTIDTFTRHGRVAFEHPEILNLWSLPAPLPVAAYTRETLAQTLSAPPFSIPAPEARLMVDHLGDVFHSIHAHSFDTKNPTTWGYKCLLLRKAERRRHEDEQSDAILKKLLVSGADVPPETARSLIENARQGFMTGTGIEAVAQIILEVGLDVIKTFGTTFLSAYLISRLEERMKERGLSSAVIAAVKKGITKVINHEYQ